MNAHDPADIETVAAELFFHWSQWDGHEEDDWEHPRPGCATCERAMAACQGAARSVLDALDLPGRERRAKAAALRDATDAWLWGGWDKALLPPPTEGIIPLAYAQRVGDWLRAYAARIAEADQ
ncbi:MAG TPA: hypothetical protein VFJ94_10685 [Intrasporangium sp.]|uniref:hypothetical protein n=1 Tax=Intrasporangium sp. TaxID=1925024 RepID=UPI002D7896C0|nr:hypothetical protein [Intrasporangium sp.]HET7398976.1 hypothetical protein [Intrasporangium sp.]